MHDISIWEWDSEKETEEVFAVLCINWCKGRYYPGEENVLKQKNWMPILEGEFIQYVKMVTQKTTAYFCSCKNFLPWVWLAATSFYGLRSLTAQ